jgi:regulator of protease activity HflC (stomatin/prohibitin superfamily)
MDNRPTLRLVAGLTLGVFLGAVALVAAHVAGDLALVASMGEGSGPDSRLLPLFEELHRARLVALPLAALLPALAGLAGTCVMLGARRRAALPPLPHRARGPRWRAWVPLPPRGNLALIGQAARWPQALLVVPLAGLTVAAALLPQAGGNPVVPDAAFLWGAVLILLGFPLLVAERVLAATPAARLPEAPSLRALLFLSTIGLPTAGVLEIAAGLGVPTLAAQFAAALSLLPCAVAAELAARAAGRCFLPPPAPDTARAVADSLLARLLAEGAQARSLMAPVRDHLGIDFARSWALAYVRAAFAPLMLALVLIAWGLSGVALVGVDQRAVYERLGAPVRVLHPGLHPILPWPLGRVRPVEFGAVHEAALRGETTIERFAAEDPTPPSADRLWEQEYPTEAWFLVAAARGERQSFEMVSADIRLLWRVGLTDADALHATYRTVDPVALLRQAGGRAVASFLAGRTLDAVLGENREAMALRLRTAIQQDLDAAETGIELAAVVIEAIHPPGGAADAYHAVQAAQIDAEASIAAERGRAHASLAEAQQLATGALTAAQAGSVETTGAATAESRRFAADRDGDRLGGGAFRYERYLANLTAALAKAQVVILDHRIEAPDAPVIDLRPPLAATGLSIRSPGE